MSRQSRPLIGARGYKGYFKPTNPSKYAGNPGEIVYRSRMELALFTKLDKHPDIERWTSDNLGADLTGPGGLAIPYTDYSKNPPKLRRYYVDAVLRTRTGRVIVIEVKPSRETRPPKPKKGPRFLQEARTYAQNQSKWAAARRFCEKRGWEFRIVTEKELGCWS